MKQQKICTGYLPEDIPLWVGLSGGVDSVVLLHLLAHSEHRSQLRAIHVNHHLHPESNQWAQQSKAFAESLGVPCEIVNVEIVKKPGESLEAVARAARMVVFENLLAAPGAILTAHHQDDQAETLLLNLLRGGGVRGLAAMPVKKALGQGRHIRPLLDMSREAIVAYAKAQQLDWVEDPSNSDTKHDRNFLRHEVMPLLRARWPHVSDSFARSASHMAEAEDTLVALAAEDFESVCCYEGKALHCERLRGLELGRQRNLLRYWCRKQGAPVPPYRQFAQIDEMLAAFARGQTQEVAWEGMTLRPYQGALYLIPPQPPLDLTGEWFWQAGECLTLPTGEVIDDKLLEAYGVPPNIRQEGVRIRYRCEGVWVRLPGRSHHHRLKKCLQAWGIPPWARARVPLVFKDDTLVVLLGEWGIQCDSSLF